MKLRQLFENIYEEQPGEFDGGLKTIGVCFGRFNPPHKGHKAVWQAAAQNPIWYVGTNQSTSGPKDPLPYDVKLQAMAAVWPKVAGHVIPEQSLLTLASRIYEEHGANVHLKVYTDEDWLVKALTQYNGVEKEHGMYKFQQIDHVKTQRLASATNLRAAVRAGDRAAFYKDMGIKPSVTLEVNGESHPVFDVVAHFLNKYPEKVKKTVAEGEVVQFPKKHKGDLDSTHDCPRCGGDLQGGKYMGHQVKVCMPCKQVYLPPNSGIDKQGNKVVDEIAGAFPSPSTRAKWAADAAASNAAEAKRQADIKAKADAERLRVNNAIVDKEQRINYHPMPDNEVPAKEGSEERNTNRLWMQISDYEKRAKATSNDIKKQHYLKMADELRAKLPTNEDDNPCWTGYKRKLGTKKYDPGSCEKVEEVAMRMQGSSQAEKDATAREKARQAEEIRKHQAIVKAYVDIMSKGQPLPPKMQQSYNTMPDFKKEVDAALANIPGRPGEVELEQRRNYHLIPKNEAMGQNRADPRMRMHMIKKLIKAHGWDLSDLELATNAEIQHEYNKLPEIQSLHKKLNISEIALPGAMIESTQAHISKRKQQPTKGLNTYGDSEHVSGDYTAYRLGMAVAGANGKDPIDMKAKSWIGKKKSTHPYTPEEQDMLKQAYKVVGAEYQDVNKGDMKSRELDDTHKVSPVAGHKKNKYGV